MQDPIPTYKYLVSRIAELYSDLAYIHVVEPRVSGYDLRDPQGEVGVTLSAWYDGC